jgi:hypothetical protein
LAQTKGTEHAYPSVAGEKVRGIQEMNNSGQVGTISLISKGANSTDLIVRLRTVPPNKREPAALYRAPGDACANPPEKPALALNPVVSGTADTGAGTTIVPISRDRLLSGNYFVIVMGEESAKHYVACGHLSVE